MHSTHDVIQNCRYRKLFDDMQHVQERSVSLSKSATLSPIDFLIYLEDYIRTLLLVGALAAILPVASAAQDPRLGSWTLVSAQSSLDPANRLSITPLQDGVHVVMSGETHFGFTANRSGHKSPASGNLGFDQIELHMIDKRQAEVKEEKNGMVVATVREKLSQDANELTTTTSIKGKADQITIWTRIGAKKPGKDLFAGEWTQDMSKTRMRQGLTVKIESDGSDGVRFLSDFSYTARFDGKHYDLKNSRNDTVTLQLVDPHTVDAIYQRDNQVTQKDRWQVSADGHQMTLTTAGTLETGQRLSEKLVFKK